MTENLFDDGVAEALQSRRQSQPDTAADPTAVTLPGGFDGLVASDAQELEAQALAAHANLSAQWAGKEDSPAGTFLGAAGARFGRRQPGDLHAECVSREQWDTLSEQFENIRQQRDQHYTARMTLDARVSVLQAELDAYVDSCARLTPAAKDHLQWLRERRAPVGGAMPDEDETLEWALERVVAKVKSDMGRKR